MTIYDRLDPELRSLSSGNQELVSLLKRLSAKSELLEYIRQHPMDRAMAHKLLEAAGIPTQVPDGALKVLDLDGGSNDPIDLTPIFYDTPDGTRWYWRRSDRPIVAVQKDNGEWEVQGATY